MVGRWDGAATRSLIMHADPLSAYPYRLLGRLAPISTIDRWFEWFWKHLRGLDSLFDLVVCANHQLSGRLISQGLGSVETVPMGVEPGLFSPGNRSPRLRRELLARVGLDESAVLLVGIGRFAGEKRWEMVLRAVAAAGRATPVGFVLAGDGPRRRRLEQLAERLRHVAVLPRIADRTELARLLASGDGLVHGCEAETFCMAAAEARASGLPLIVPDRGAAVDQLVPGAGAIYRSGREDSLADAIATFAAAGPELQHARAVHNAHARTMDEHFEQLFGRYAQLAGERIGMLELPLTAAAMLPASVAATAGVAV